MNTTLESLCETGSSVCAHKNGALKDEAAFNRAVEAFTEAKSIIFNSMITNEEALMLQMLKEKRGYRLINQEAKRFQEFLGSFSMLSGKQLYGADLESVAAADGVIVVGCSVSTDSPRLRESLEKADKRDAYLTYMHPLEDESLKGIVTQVKYEVSSEEGILAMLADLAVNDEGRERFESFFDDLDIGYICGESSVGEEEFEEMNEKLLDRKKRVLVIGSDIYNHPRAENIAKILGMISKYSDFEICMIPPEGNTLGVALICDLDDKVEGKSIGYNVEADYLLSSLGRGDLDMPGMRQKEGSFTSLNKRVVPLKADPYSGYRLDDIASALGVHAEDGIDYTAKLPATSGYKAVAFDNLQDGYELENIEIKIDDEKIEEVDEISEFNGTVVYRCNHPLTQIEDNLLLLGSKQFATAARIQAGAMVRFEMDGKTYERKFKVDEDLKGTIAYNPVIDSTDNYDEYRYKRVKLEEVDE